MFMAKIKIASDSTADIPKQVAQDLNISILPLTILIDDKEYRDGYDISTQEFYKILDSQDKLPVSSQVSVALYVEMYKQVWQEGYSDLVHVAINSKGSGTYQAGVLAKTLFFEEHKEAEGKFQIHLIDSKTYSMAYGWAVVEAARLARDGAPVDQILKVIEDWVTNVYPLFVPLDLKCVKKSGRISAVAAFVGDALGLKPMITFENGESKIISKVRGEKKAIKDLTEVFVKEHKAGTPYMLVYGNNMDQYHKFKEACIEASGQEPEMEYPVGCIISINTGPNMLGIIFRR